jgi:triphosphoribosyl-dephospho-CoA synthase
MDSMSNCQKAQYISQCLQLAINLEVSVPKPGNVSLNNSFEGTRLEHFLASAIAAAPSFQEAAYRGILVSKKRLGLKKLGLGELIKICTADVAIWQSGGNTILGTIMLFMPIAVAAGMTFTNKEFNYDFVMLRSNIDEAVKATSSMDSVHLYEAIDIAVPSGLGKAPDLDATDANSKKRLLKENVTLYDVFKIAAGYDDICFEWVNNYPITFEAFEYLRIQLKCKPLKVAVTNVFLKILSERPDTFIERKMGKDRALEVSDQAKAVLELGALETTTGRDSLIEFDRKLREKGNQCNPGTTADLVAASLLLCTLGGFRP